MPYPSPLLALPGEIRNQIWRHLLCPHGIVNPDINFKMYCKYLRSHYPDLGEKENNDERNQEVDNEEQEHKKNDRDERFAHSVRAIHALPVSILRVNHQLHNECSFILYSNILYFELSPTVIISFLNHRPARDRMHIRHLRFGPICTSAADYDPTSCWVKLCKYIATKLNIEIVTVWVPQRVGIHSDGKIFWPALYGLVRLLLDGNIESVRLFFATRGDPVIENDFEPSVLEPITLPKDEVLEDLYAVHRAIYSGQEIEYYGYKWNYEAERVWQPSDSKGYKKKVEIKRRLPLKIEREDGAMENEGTVVVLKRDH